MSNPFFVPPEIGPGQIILLVQRSAPALPAALPNIATSGQRNQERRTGRFDMFPRHAVPVVASRDRLRLAERARLV